MTAKIPAQTFKIILLLLFAGWYTKASANPPAREKISGIVKTADGRPAASINVALKGTVWGAVTDAEGRFAFTAPAGKYTMVVSSVSAHRKELPVEIRPGVENVIPGVTIMEDAHALEQVVVTGQFSPQSLRNSVYKVRAVNRAQIEQKAAQNIQSVLNTEIGVRLSNDMALGETDFELMGMSGQNVKVLIDGVPLIDRGANKQSLSQIDINTVERIEIVEGPMSVAYGTDALAGVINIITRKPRANEGKTSWNMSYGTHEESAGTEYDWVTREGIHAENIRAGVTTPSGLYADGGFTRNATGGWQGEKTGREKMWQPKNQFLYSGSLGFARRQFDARYRLDYLDEEIDNPINGTALHPEKISDRNYLTKRFTHQLQADWKPSNRLGFNMAASYQDYRRQTRTIDTDLSTGQKTLSPEESAQDISAMQAAFGRLTATWRVNSRLTLQPGMDYKWEKASGQRIHGEPEIADLAAYLSAEWQATEWLDLRPGVRKILAGVTREWLGQNPGYTPPAIIPAMLAKLSLGKEVDLRLSYAYGFRAPALRELYMSMHNANHNIDGNPDLRAEYSDAYSASATWRVLHGGEIRLTSTLTGFFNDFKDRITTAEDVNDPQHTTYYNIDRYKTAGGTLENALAWRDLTANVGFSLVGRYNRFSADYRDLPQFRFSPEVTASATYSITKTGTGINLFYKFTGSREEYSYKTGDASPTLRGMRSYHWADVTVTQKLWDGISFGAGVRNLFDVTTVDNSSGGGMGSSGNASLVGCGRSWFAALTFNFGNNQ